MKDKLTAVALIVALSGAIVFVGWFGHRLGDPTWVGSVILGLVSLMGLIIMWLKTPPEKAAKTLDEAVTSALVETVEKVAEKKS